MESNAVHRSVVTLIWLSAATVALVAFVAGSSVSAQQFRRQPELAGSWAPLNTEWISNQSVPVDYIGLALTEEGRLRALTYSESQLSMFERQCAGWPAYYFVVGPFGLRIWSDAEPVNGTVVSYTIGAWEDRQPMVIWMDGRPHPSQYAEHTRAGFTTGRWEGSTLVAETTHMKAGNLRKNGPPMSAAAKMTSRFFRHGDLLTVVVVLEDPYYLAEPTVFSKSFDAATTELPAVGPPCMPIFEGRSPDDPAPHYLPEKNPFLDELTKKYGIPREVILGYPETRYPDYRSQLKR